MKDGKQTTEYTLTRIAGIIAALIVVIAPVLASQGIITDALAMTLVTVAGLAGGGSNAAYSTSRGKVKAAEALKDLAGK